MIDADNKFTFEPFIKLRSIVLSFLIASVIGFSCALIYIVAYTFQFYGPERVVWGVSQAIIPESEVKQELVKLQDELHQTNSKLANLTQAIANARKLGSTGITNATEARARLANPDPKSDATSEIKSKSNLKKMMAPAQGMGGDDTDSILDSLLFRLKGIQEYQNNFESKDYVSIIESTPIGVPVSGELTSEYGIRISPFSGYRQTHRGIDVAMKRGSELYATADGTVEITGWGTGFGNHIIIDHGIGTDGDRFETLYAHLSQIYTKPGARVHRGEKIGLVGTSGHSTGPHVHYEVRKNGIAVNPEPFVELASLLD